MDFLILAVVIAVGLFVWSMVSTTVLGFLPASLTTNTYFTLLVNAIIVAGVVVLAGKFHGKIGSGIKEAV